MGGDAAHKDVQAFADLIHEKTFGKLKTAWYSGFNKLIDENYIQNFNFIKIGNYQEESGPLNKKTPNQRLYKIADGKMEDVTRRMWKQ